MPLQLGRETNIENLQKAAAKWTLGASVLGMFVYTGIEYVLDPPESASYFFLHHLTHVAIIAGAVWFASWMLINRMILRPVSQIFTHLKRMAAGRIDYLDGDMGSRELADVAHTINQLVAKLSRGRDVGSVSKGLDSLRELRRELSGVTERLGEDAVPVMRALTTLEGELLHVLQEVPESTAACCAHGGSECLPPAN